MIPAFIVLLVIAVALGGYLVFDILNSKKKAAAVAETADSAEAVVAEAPATTDEEDSSAIEKADDMPEAKYSINEDELASAITKGEALRKSVTVQDADNLIKDEVAEKFVEIEDKASDKTKQGIVNIDTLSQYFENGEVVTLEEIKNRVPKFNKKTTYLKVLARGKLDKALTIEADSFSIQAVKMILLTGGKAIRKS